MNISFPFNVTNVRTGEVLAATRAFHNQNTGSYKQEREEADRRGVPRAKKGDGQFGQFIKEHRNVKWTYTVYRELYIVPERFGLDEVPHSIASANLPVFCAGIAEWRAGDVVTVNNWTGHYQVPSARAASDIIEAWADSGFTVHVGALIH
jgi:hypothetical protein